MDLPYRKDDLHSMKMTNGLQQKVNFLVSKLFRGWERGSKSHFRFGQMQQGGKQILFIEKRNI